MLTRESLDSRDAAVAMRHGGLVPQAAVGDDAALWAAFAAAATTEQFCLGWLTILCRLLPRARAAFLLLEEERGQYKVGATWPDPAADLAYLAPAAELALRQRRGLVHPPPQDAGTTPHAEHVAYPVEVGGHAYGVVVVDLADPAGADAAAGDRAAALRELHWGVGWLETLFRRRDAEHERAARERVAFALGVLAAACEHPRLPAAAMALVNELATRLPCRRASLGMVHRGVTVRLTAISHGASFARRSRHVSAIENAMEEALDQAATVALPAPPAAGRLIALAHGALARLSGSRSLVSVVACSGGRPVGVLTVEQDDARPVFDAQAIERLEAAAELLGPALEMKRRTHRLVAGRLADSTGETLVAVFGRRRPGATLIAILVVGAIAALGSWHADFTVSGYAVVEAAQLHSVVAPFDGFIAAAPARAGDTVGAGELLASLDDRDLQLEALRARSALQEQLLKYGEALGRQDRVAMRVLQAGIDEARAELVIDDDKIARARLVSAVRGAVVSGDLSQMIGSPVERGKTLFEVAPLDAWRVAIQIDERDIAEVRPGQPGRLFLAGLTNRVIPFVVRAVLPIATSAEGENGFRVEAELHDASGALRPGMEGVGKIRVSRRPALTIWLRPVLIWARTTLWRWSP